MRMADMVSYLESNGFKVSMIYNRELKRYEFNIAKYGKSMTSYFEYPNGVDRETVNLAQEGFLDSMLDRFEREVIVDLKRNVNAIYGKLPSYSGKHWSCMNELFEEYCKNDVKMTEEVYKMWPKVNPLFAQGCGIKKVIFNDPATIVLWTDGTKTVVKAENETFDEEKGLAMAISKKALGNKGNYYTTFSKWLPKEEKTPTLDIDVTAVVGEATEAIEQLGVRLRRFRKRRGL